MTPSGSQTGIVGMVSGQRSNVDPSEPIYTDPSLFEFGRCSLIRPGVKRNENIQFI